VTGGAPAGARRAAHWVGTGLVPDGAGDASGVVGPGDGLALVLVVAAGGV
jgi:hypothetical protein